MPKRIFTLVLSVFALLAATAAAGALVRLQEDFANLNVDYWTTVAGVLVAGAMALVALGIGVRFLYFGFFGRHMASDVWLRPILVSIGLFFPGFVVSAFLSILLVSRFWSGRAANFDVALLISMGLGVATSLGGAIWMSQRRSRAAVR